MWVSVAGVVSQPDIVVNPVATCTDEQFTWCPTERDVGSADVDTVAPHTYHSHSPADRASCHRQLWLRQPAVMC
ncbi:unnamed protein product [Protopolystoma xenopodis]|uniref:Uncharacterized protein n=1 Tax=Protopolystoma xenopodis TaxID=117903 RepID=A0A3S5B056_9PLAT|nr:unnamed protein product [Protopolystoma xenopodis]